MRSEQRLRLSVRDSEDITVMSSLLQDSVISVSDMSYLSGENRFVLVANRFLWESAGDLDNIPQSFPNFGRVLCGVCFENVRSVRQKGLNRKIKNQIVSLLSVSLSDKCQIDLVFSACISVRLEVSDLFCHLQDINEPWPTDARPSHGVDSLPVGER